VKLIASIHEEEAMAISLGHRRHKVVTSSELWLGSAIETVYSSRGLLWEKGRWDDEDSIGCLGLRDSA
jgi:hypothetical protein